jgi:hypothetical protein
MIGLARRITRWGIGIVVLLAIAGAGAVLALDSIAVAAIRAVGPRLLDVEVGLTSASIGIIRPSTTLDGLKVGNPTGFSPEPCVALKHLDIEVSARAALDREIVIPSMLIDGLVLRLEKRDGIINVQQVVDNASRAIGGGSTAPEQPKSSAGSGTKVTIRQLTLRNVRLIASGDVAKVPTGLDVTLGELVLRDVSSDNPTGNLGEQLLTIILDDVVAAVLKKGASNLAEGAVKALDGALSRLGDGAGMTTELLDKLKEHGGKALEDAGKTVIDGAGKALDGLLGGSKEKK